MQIIEKKINEINPYKNNPRNNDAAVDPVACSIRDFGFRVPIVIDGAGVIVAGHTRYRAAKKLGLEMVPCVVADDLTDEQIRAFRLADNKTAEKAKWNEDLLAEELAAIDIDMSDYGFLLEPVDVSDINECDLIATPPSVAQPGDMFQLGDHRLICGDCCSSDIARLMDGAKADLYLTDPPYNVDYEGAAGKIENDSMKNDVFRDFLVSAFKVANEVMRPGAAFYIWHSETEGINFRGACEDTGWQIRQCLIWNKDQFVIGRQDYQWKHEPCLYGWKSGAAHYFRHCRKNNTVFTDSILENKTKNELIQIIRKFDIESSVIDEDRPKISADHPTMKPVKLIARLVANSTRPGEIVFDGFGGSGSTLIACEQLGRRCYMSELDPSFADVIIRRWEDLTGKKAIKIN